jgi:AraC family transcriptional regulator
MSAAAELQAPCQPLPPGHFLGGVTRRRHDDGFIVTEIVHRAPRRMPAHDHQAAHVALLTGGEYNQEVGGRVVPLSPRRAVYHPPAFRHRDDIGEAGASFLVVELTGRLAALAAEILPREPVFDEPGDLATLLRRLHLEMAAGDPGAALIRQGLVLELFGAFARRSRAAERRPPQWALAADALLRERPAHRWSAAELSAAVGVSPFQLARGVRRAFGETVGDRLRRARLEAARMQLGIPGNDLAEVAYSCGFSDQSHLTRAFRRAYGITPGAFRKSAASSR